MQLNLWCSHKAFYFVKLVVILMQFPFVVNPVHSREHSRPPGYEKVRADCLYLEYLYALLVLEPMYLTLCFDMSGNCPLCLSFHHYFMDSETVFMLSNVLCHHSLVLLITNGLPCPQESVPAKHCTSIRDSEREAGQELLNLLQGKFWKCL